MHKNPAKFLCGQSISILLSLSVACRERLSTEFVPQLLLEVAFDALLCTLSLLAGLVIAPKAGRAPLYVLVASAWVMLMGDVLFFYTLNYTNNYVCTFFDQLNYPTATLVEYALRRRGVQSRFVFVAYLALLVLTVGLGFACSEERFRFSYLCVVTGLLFNACYVAAEFIQEKTTSTTGVLAFMRDSAFCRIVTTSFILLVLRTAGCFRLSSAWKFYTENMFYSAAAVAFYLCFYISSVLYIDCFDVSTYSASLISSSIYVVVLGESSESSVKIKTLGALIPCLLLVYVLICSSKGAN